MAANAARRHSRRKERGEAAAYITFLTLGKPITKQKTRQHIAGSVEGKQQNTPKRTDAAAL